MLLTHPARRQRAVTAHVAPKLRTALLNRHTLKYALLAVVASVVLLLSATQINYTTSFLPITALYRQPQSSLQLDTYSLQLHSTPIFEPYSSSIRTQIVSLIEQYANADNQVLLLQVYTVQHIPLLINFACFAVEHSIQHHYVALTYSTAVYNAVRDAKLRALQLASIDNTALATPLVVNSLTHLQLQYHTNKLIDVLQSHSISVLLTDIYVQWYTNPFALFHQSAQCAMSLYMLGSKLHSQSLILRTPHASLDSVQQCLQQQIQYTAIHGVAHHRFVHDINSNCMYITQHCVVDNKNVVDYHTMYDTIQLQRAAMYGSIDAVLFDVHNVSAGGVMSQLASYSSMRYGELTANGVQCAVNVINQHVQHSKVSAFVLDIYVLVDTQHAVLQSLLDTYEHKTLFEAVNIYVTVEYADNAVYMRTITALQSYHWPYGTLNIYVLESKLGYTVNWLLSLDLQQSDDHFVLFLHSAQHTDINTLLQRLTVDMYNDILTDAQLKGWQLPSTATMYSQHSTFDNTLYMPNTVQRFIEYIDTLSVRTSSDLCIYAHTGNRAQVSDIQLYFDKYVFDTGSYVLGICADVARDSTPLHDIFSSAVDDRIKLQYYKQYIPHALSQQYIDQTKLHQQQYSKLYDVHFDIEDTVTSDYNACYVKQHDAPLQLHPVAHTDELYHNITQHTSHTAPTNFVDHYVEYYTRYMQHINDFVHTNPQSAITHRDVRFVVYSPTKPVDWSRHLRGIYFTFLLAVLTQRIAVIDLALYFELYNLPQQFIDHHVKLSMADWQLLYDNYEHDTILFEHSLYQLQFTDLNTFYTQHFAVHTSHVAHDRALCYNTLYQHLCYTLFGTSRMQHVGAVTQFLLSHPKPAYLQQVNAVQSNLVNTRLASTERNYLVLIHANVMPQHYPTNATAEQPLPGITAAYWQCVQSVLQYSVYPPHRTTLLFLTNKPNKYVQPVVDKLLGRYGHLVYDLHSTTAQLTNKDTPDILTGRAIPSDLLYAYLVGEADMTVMTESTYSLFNAARTNFVHRAHVVRVGEAERRDKQGNLIAEAEQEYCGTLHRTDLVWTEDVLF